MLNEREIDELLQPIIDEQEEVSFWVIMLIIRRIKKIGMLPLSEINSLAYLAETNRDIKAISSRLRQLHANQVINIRKTLNIIANDSYKDSKKYFDAVGKAFLPIEKNKEVRSVVSSVAKSAIADYKRVFRTQAFMIRDPKNPAILIPTQMSEAYRNTINEAARNVQAGNVDYKSAMRKVTKQLVNSGIKTVEYDPRSGKIWSQRTETAVRRNMLDAVRNLNQGIQDEVGKQFGADGKEITVHECSAPDHEPVQGHQFSNEEFDKLQTEEYFEDYYGQKFEPIRRAIGTLNCRHFTFSIVLGVNPPIHSKEELEGYKERNKQGYTDKNGKHHTKYECTQIQRKLEAKIRRAKEQQIAARERGDKEEAKKWQREVNELTDEYINFSNASGLQPLPSKISVSGYHKISVK